MDKVFGAEVFFKDGQWYSRCLKNEVGELQRPDLEKSEAWKKAVKFAEAFLAAKVTVPSFAMPVINSTLTIAINLYGEEILVAMLTDPEAVEHDLQIIQDVCLEMYKWYMEHIPADQLQQCLFDMRAQPPGYGQICGCSTQLISPELYEKYILRLDNERLGFFPHGGMIHLCGSHTHLIPLFARMENLKSVQLNDRASEDLEYYVQGLREDQVIYLFTCEGMQKERALEIVGNRRMVLVDFYHW